MKLSQWHDGNVKPVHIGVYQRNYGATNSLYCNFDGLNWMCSGEEVIDAALITYISPLQEIKWRGIVKDKK